MEQQFDNNNRLLGIRFKKSSVMNEKVRIYIKYNNEYEYVL